MTALTRDYTITFNPMQILKQTSSYFPRILVMYLLFYLHVAFQIGVITVLGEPLYSSDCSMAIFFALGMLYYVAENRGHLTLKTTLKQKKSIAYKKQVLGNIVMALCLYCIVILFAVLFNNQHYMWNLVDFLGIGHETHWQLYRFITITFPNGDVAAMLALMFVGYFLVQFLFDKRTIEPAKG